MALEVAGSKPVTRPMCRFLRNEAGRSWSVETSTSRYNSIGRDGSLAGVAELVDALVLGTSGESRGGSSPSARTIVAWRIFYGVMARR